MNKRKAVGFHHDRLFMSLGIDSLSTIFRYLRTTDLRSLRNTCVEFKKITDSLMVWKFLRGETKDLMELIKISNSSPMPLHIITNSHIDLSNIENLPDNIALNIKTLTMDESVLNTNWICKLPCLEGLSLNRVEITQEELEQILDHHSDLRSLELSLCTDLLISYFPSTLTKLSIDDTIKPSSDIFNHFGEYFSRLLDLGCDQMDFRNMQHLPTQLTRLYFRLHQEPVS